MLFFFSVRRLKNYNYTLDSIKFFCAVAVIVIHLTSFLHLQGKATLFNYYIYRYFLEIAVPFFFATSGYFLASRNQEYLKVYAKKILNLFITLSIFYIFVDFLSIFFERIVFGYLFWDRIKGIFNNFTASNLINGTFGKFHLWFLMALFISVILIYLMRFFVLNEKTMLLISAILYFISMSGFIDFSSIVKWGGFPKGLFFVSLGVYVYSIRNAKIKYPLLSSILCLIGFEVYNILSASNLSIILLSMSIFFLMMYAANFKGRKTVFSSLGKHSLAIYLMHVFIYETFYKILKYLNVNIDIFRENVFYLIILSVICIIGSVFVYKIVTKILMPIEKSTNYLLNINVSK